MSPLIPERKKSKKSTRKRVFELVEPDGGVSIAADHTPKGPLVRRLRPLL